MRFQAPRGTQDVLPSESHLWLRLEQEFRTIAALYGYREIRTPTFEDYDLFVRTSGDSSEVVSKQMYDFVDKGDRHVALKPEETAPAIRAVIEHGLCPPGTVLRLSYITPFFRYERPQKGRLREPHQCGLELIGSSSHLADAEVIEATVKFYERIGVPNISVSLNSIGRDECRGKFREALLKFAEPVLKDADEEVRARALKNPLRMLDSKDPKLQEALREAPPILDFLEEDSRERFEALQSALSEAGIQYQVTPSIVRGLDYYTETVFEVLSTSLGAQSALCGGGRYDNLVKELGGQSTPAVGVGIGVERALIVLDAVGSSWRAPRLELYIVAATEDARLKARELARRCRALGITVGLDLDGKKMAAQLKQADRLDAVRALIIGSDELATGSVTIRDLSSGDQQTISESELFDVLRGNAP